MAVNMESTNKKRHGLWMFHRTLRQHFGQDVIWWAEENEKAMNMVEYANIFIARGQYEYSVAIILSRCAFRYMRLNKITQTAGAYIDICNTIAERIGTTIRAIESAVRYVSDVRRKSRIVFNDEFERPHSNAKTITELFAEHRRRKQAREELENRTCAVCKKHPTSQKNNTISTVFMDLVLQTRITPKHEERPWAPRVCFSCFMTLKKLEKQWNASEESRKLINRAKRKINEASKDNARTA